MSAIAGAIQSRSNSVGVDPAAFIDPELTTEIIRSRTYMDGRWLEATRIAECPDGVNKQLLPVNMSCFTARVVTTVAPKTHVASHSHDGAVLRYIASGSLNLNNVAYEAGDWILVPPGAAYEIDTEQGYTAVVDYKSCIECSNSF